MSKDLKNDIDLERTTCLNEDAGASHKNLFFDNGAKLESDCDPQLIIHIPFNQPVNIKSLGLKFISDMSRKPTIIKLFKNRNSLDFDEAEDLIPTEEIEIDEDDESKDMLVDLRFVKFQNVRSLHIFCEDSQGGEKTALETMQLFGSAKTSMDMKGFKDACKT